MSNNLKNTAIEDFDWEAYENGETLTSASKEEQVAEYDKTLSSINANEVVKGTVTAINKREVIVNVGYKSEGVIPVYDGSCSVWITVNSKSTITPAKAHFFITDEKGNVIVDCDEKNDVYSVVNKTTGTKLESKLTFNPNKDCYANYQLWVQFEDAGGKRYNKIATGYAFSKPLTMDQFIFPYGCQKGAPDLLTKSFGEALFDLLSRG